MICDKTGQSEVAGGGQSTAALKLCLLGYYRAAFTPNLIDMWTIRSHHLQLEPERILLFFYDVEDEQVIHLYWSVGELVAPAWRVYLDPGEVFPKKEMQGGKAPGAALIHHPNVLRHFPIRSCQVGWSHYYIIIMVSFLSFIRVIAAICHSEGNVPVDKDL